jgi:aldose 1-epimerase
MKVSSKNFGTMCDGEEVRIFSITNDRGMEVRAINYGGIIASIKVPDRNGYLDDVVLGHDSLEGYLHRTRYFGVLIGRFANRIACGRFTLNGVAYQLAVNNGQNHLHGGVRGFDKVVWAAQEIDDGVELNYVSKDGEENYPGNLSATVTYRLNDANELRLDYYASTDRDTIINLTNHSYFNLAGSGTILNHELQIQADAFTPIDETLIPTGEIRDVAGTAMDFRSSTSIGALMDKDDDQLRFARGYDHNFVLRGEPGTLRTIAKLYEPQSGRTMEVITTQPGLQFYSGNYLDGTLVGRSGRAYLRNSGCCLEAQHFPDSPNQPTFPSTVLRPGEKYHHTTIYRFTVE